VREPGGPRARARGPEERATTHIAGGEQEGAPAGGDGDQGGRE
jgi:hypothetical protein